VFFVVGVFGLLTETEFAFALVGALLVVAAKWMWKDLRAAAFVLAATIGSFLVAYALFPSYFTQYARVKLIARLAPQRSTGQRLRLWVGGLDDFVVLDTRADRNFTLAVVIAVVVLLATLPLWYRAVWKTVREQPIVAAALGVGGVSFVGLTTAFVLGRVPPHAAGWQYVIVFWPSVVLLAAVIVRRLGTRQAAVALLVVAAIIGANAVRWEHKYSDQYVRQRRAVREVSRATLVISDCLLRGYTPGAAMWVPPGSLFLLAAPGGATPPPIPPEADRSRPVLFDADGCLPAVTNVDGLLSTLGFVRGRRIGPIGPIRVYRLTARS
jgi:hypothetical protein